MSDFVLPGSLNWSCILNSSSLPPPVFCGPVIPWLPLVTAAVAAGLQLAIWFRRNPVLLLGELVDLVDPIPAIGEEQPQIPAIAVEEQRQPGGLQVPPIEEVVVKEPLPDEQAPWIGIICDEGQVPAAIRAICHKVEARIHLSGPQEGPFDPDTGYDSDASGSSNSGDQSYPSVHHLELEVRDITHIVPTSMADLEQMLRSLSEEQRGETITRFCDVLKKALMHHIGSETLSDPSFLTIKSTKNWVLRLKSSAIVCRLMWKQLERQNQQLYREQNYSCLAEVAGQSMNNLLFEIASSFSDARWSANHIRYMLHIFDTLVEVLDYIKELPFSRSDTVQNKVTYIYGKIVQNMHVILGEIANDGRIRNESGIHPATKYLMHALKFFCDKKDMLQAVLGSRDYTVDLHDRWVLKLEEDAGRLFKNEKDKQYIFILNNAWFVFQKRNDPNMLLSIEQEWVDSVIQKYIKDYLGEFWLPLLTSLCLDEFTRKFETICSHPRILKVRTELKEKLVQEIMMLSLGPNGIFLRFFNNELLTGRSSAGSACGFWKKQKSMTLKIMSRVKGLFERKNTSQCILITVADFENMVKGLFER